MKCRTSLIDDDLFTICALCHASQLMKRHAALSKKMMFFASWAVYQLHGDSDVDVQDARLYATTSISIKSHVEWGLAISAAIRENFVK